MKLIFVCNNCGAHGLVKIDEDHEIECCPSCGASLDIDEDIDEDEDE